MQNENSKNGNPEDEISFEERMNVPYNEKKKGDSELKIQNYDNAMKHYAKAIMSIKILMDEKCLFGTILEDYVKDVGMPSNLNLSLCYLNSKEWAMAIPHLNKVIDFDNAHVKARYRRCLCYVNLGTFEKAEEDLEFLKGKIGGTKEFEELKTGYDQKKGKVRKEEKKFYNKMLKEYINGK